MARRKSNDENEIGGEMISHLSPRVPNSEIPGMLEIDHHRGVIYFHTSDPDIAQQYGSVSVFRICRLPTPIPQRALDITHLHGVDWS